MAAAGTLRFNKLSDYERGIKMSEPQNWSEWHEERKRFKERETEGFIKDIAALEAHLIKLRQVAPKDKAGVLHSNAWDYCNKLQKFHDKVMEYLENIK